MSDDNTETNDSPKPFDFSGYPPNSLFHDRRSGRDRRAPQFDGTGASGTPLSSAKRQPERRARKERRRRIDPTTFEKQYTDDELEFMNAMQSFKERTGKSFPTHGEVLKVAMSLGYRRIVVDPGDGWGAAEEGRGTPA